MNLRLGKNNNPELKNEAINDLNLNQTNEIQFDELKENKKLRTANSKVFVLPNGDYRKVVYAKNVHYYNEEEEAYRTIDNTFVPVLDKNNNEITGYENRYNSCKIRLAAKLDSKKLMSISKGNYNISWELIEETPVEDTTQNSFTNIRKIRKINRLSVAQAIEKIKENKTIRKEMNPANLDGEIIYKDAFDKADLQYSIHSNAVKENIIIKEQSDSYEFAFKITTENLTVKLSDDRQNLLFCSAEGEDVFRIPMPVMQDAAGKVSSEIYYDVDDCGEGENVFVFKIIADSAWINAPERILPVTIDPMIGVYDKAYCIDYSYQNSKGSSFDGIGANSDSSKGINRLFIKFNMHDFGKNVIVNSVKLNVDTFDYNPETIKSFIAHRLSSNTNINSLTFNTQYESKALDLVQFLPDNVASIDLTEYFENLHYRGKYDEQSSNFTNNGIVIKALNENTTANNLIQFKDNFNLVFDYRVNSGMHKNQAYSTNDLGRSGVSQVNLRTGSLTFINEDIKVEGNRFPVNIVNVYNSYAANGGYDLNGTADSNYPKFATNGWKLNYQQFLIPEAYVYGRGSSVQRFRYIDGEGTTHYLEYKGSRNYDLVFADEDGLGLTIYVKGHTWDSVYTVYDSQQNQMIFKGQRLCEIKKRSGDKTVITFREDINGNDVKFYQIDTITINSDRIVKFDYNSYNLLTNITYKNEKITYAYDYYKRLTSITYPDGNKTEFTYTGNGALESVKDVSGKKITYSYKSTQPFMVEKIAESSVYSSINNNSAIIGNMSGDSLTISYLSKNLVKTVDNKNIVTIYNFDSEGNATVVFENKSSDTSVMAPASEISYGSRDQARSISCIIPFNGTNYAPNKGDSYTINANTQSDTQITFLPANLFTEGKTYVLSGFAKADSATIDEDDLIGSARTFELTAIVAYNGSDREIYHAKFDDRNTSWQIAATAFTIGAGLTGITLFASYRNNINSATFNNIKFVKCNAAITERKICRNDNPLDYFDVEDIDKTTYKIKQDGVEDSNQWPEYSHTQKVKYNDMVKMLQDIKDCDVVTVRAKNGQYLISKAADVTFTLKNKKSYALSDLGKKNITVTEIGTVESEYNPYFDNNGTQYRKVIKDGTKEYTSTVRYDVYGQKIWEKDIRGIETDYSYDKYGNMISARTSHDNGYLEMLSMKKYEGGDHLTSETEESTMGWNDYYYNDENGLLKYSIDHSGQRTDYSYNSIKNIKNIEANIQDSNGTTCNRNSFLYNKDYLTQVSHNGINYDFTYSGLGDITEVAIAGKRVLSHSVSRSANGDTETTVELDESGAMASNTVVSKDRYGRVKTVTRNGSNFVENTYENAYGSAKLTKTIDNCAGVVYNYYYDTDGKVSQITYSGNRSGTISTEKDKRKRVTKQTHSFGGGTSLIYNYTYEDYPDETISKIGLSGKFEQSISYDDFMRTNEITLQSNGGLTISETYSYFSPYKTWRTTRYVNFVSYTIGSTSEEDKYEYDNNFNISKIETPRGEITYEYDGLNRLVQEINHITDKKYNYTYDAGGNILTKKITSLYSQQVEKQYKYTYDYGNKDRLTSFGSESISGYDNQGRPTIYRGWNLVWKNGRVNTFTKNNKVHTCEYDANGIRFKKIANGLQHEYYLEDNKIVREVVNGNDSYELLYMYGANGIAGFTYKKNGSTANYYYRKNLQGDIVAVYGENGNKYAEYAYDAWGNCSVIFSNNGVASLNSFRYRGYYWDGEFGLYYLNARYYDPEVGRFISQDSIGYIDPGILNGLNLFAYSLNNPVMGIDPDGTDAIYVTIYGGSDGRGIKVVGHAVLLIQDSDGTWWLTDFNPTNGVLFGEKGQVRCETIDDLNQYFDSYLPKNFGQWISSLFNCYGCKTVYYSGDYTQSLTLAQSFSNSENGFGDYNLIIHNCLHYVRTLLASNEKAGPIMSICFKNTFSFCMPTIFSTQSKLFAVVDAVFSAAKKLQAYMI